MASAKTQKIDTQKLLPLLESIGWSLKAAQSAFSTDFTQPVSPEVKKHLWETIRIARFWRQIFPSARIESMKFLNPGNGGVGMMSKPGSGSGGGG